MKTPLVTLLFAALIFSGCSGPAATSKKSPIATIEPAPPGYYLVVGMVKHPGLIKCDGEAETLMTIISKAGGISDTDFHRKLKIFVNNAGETRYYRIEKILAAQVADPLLPCGATIRISTRAILAE